MVKTVLRRAWRAVVHDVASAATDASTAARDIVHAARATTVQVLNVVFGNGPTSAQWWTAGGAFSICLPAHVGLLVADLRRRLLLVVSSVHGCFVELAAASEGGNAPEPPLKHLLFSKFQIGLTHAEAEPTYDLRLSMPSMATM